MFAYLTRDRRRQTKLLRKTQRKSDYRGWYVKSEKMQVRHPTPTHPGPHTPTRHSLILTPPKSGRKGHFPTFDVRPRPVDQYNIGDPVPENPEPLRYSAAACRVAGTGSPPLVDSFKFCR